MDDLQDDSELHDSTIEKVEAHFGFTEFECDPQDITSALKIEPIEAHRKGEPLLLPNGHQIPSPCHSWWIESDSNSKDINVHLRQLLQRLEGKEALIRPEWNPLFSIRWIGNYLYAGSGPSFEKDVIAGIARYGAGLGQDIYQVDRDDDTATTANKSPSNQR